MFFHKIAPPFHKKQLLYIIIDDNQKINNEESEKNKKKEDKICPLLYLSLIHIFITVVLYYILPHKTQWLVLLAASYVYYIYSGPRYVYFLSLIHI